MSKIRDFIFNQNRVCLKIFFAFIIGNIFPFFAFSQTSETGATLTTYYPAPYGVYQTLRLSPATSAPICDEGAMYYNDSDSQLYVCDGTWKSLGYWTLSGTNLYPNDASWNVGIGTTTPQRQFVVAATTPTMTLKRSGTSDTGLGWAIYSPSTGNDFRISEYLDANWSTASDRLAISKGGNVGINAAPVATSGTAKALKVNNTLIFSPSTSSDYANEGALYYNDTDNRFKYYDGSGWKEPKVSLGETISPSPQANIVANTASWGCGPFQSSSDRSGNCTYVGASVACPAGSVAVGISLLAEDTCRRGCFDSPNYDLIDYRKLRVKCKKLNF